MILIILTTIFLLGYIAISLEHPLKINKASISLLTAFILWTTIAFSGIIDHDIHHVLSEHLSPIAEIVFFLMGAMAIVEVIDSHQGFQIITDRIGTMKKRKLLVVLGIITFLLSAVLDNLATTIVMMSIMLKFISTLKDRTVFTGIIVIAANAGGAFSPIGDITTTMLWIGGQITPSGIITSTFLPSLTSFLIPLIIAVFMIKNNDPDLANNEVSNSDHHIVRVKQWKKTLIFTIGIMSLIAVPVFKITSGLPPFMGIIGALSIIWILTEILHRGELDHDKKHFSVTTALREIDLSSILFFVGILLSVAALEISGILSLFTKYLDSAIQNINIIPSILGLFSAIFDNVPLVAASMQMYSLDRIQSDSSFWQLLAYTAGTGGSILIIGSAAGVTAMGITKVPFGLYAIKIGPLALLGYITGLIVFYVQIGFKI